MKLEPPGGTYPYLGPAEDKELIGQMQEMVSPTFTLDQAAGMCSMVSDITSGAERSSARHLSGPT